MVLSAIVGSGACFGLGGPLDVIDLSPRVLGRAGLAGAGGLAVLLLDMILSLSQGSCYSRVFGITFAALRLVLWITFSILFW